MPRRAAQSAGWTRERVIDVIVRWHEVYGRTPNTGDWRRSQVVDGMACPTNCSITRLFGSHGAALEAAGFEFRPRVRWDEHSVTTALQRWAHLRGAPPRAIDWSPSELQLLGDIGVERFARVTAGNGQWPSAATVRTLFGSWDAAITAAGFELRSSWTRERVEGALRRWFDSFGKLPTTTEWLVRSTNPRTSTPTPGSKDVSATHGGFTAAFEAAGFKRHQFPKHRANQRVTKDDVLEAIRAWTNRYATAPTSRDWDLTRLRADDDAVAIGRLQRAREAGIRVPKNDTVSARFGTFDEAVVQAGCAHRVPRPMRTQVVGRIRKWDRDYVIDALRAWHNAHGCAPSTFDWRRATTSGALRHPNNPQVLKLFGSWPAAIEAAGLTYVGRALWPKERILDAVRDWTALYGSPPCNRDWTRSELKRTGDHTGLARLDAHPKRWPSNSTVRTALGSMQRAVELAHGPTE